jgi:hypothetical protein
MQQQQQQQATQHQGNISNDLQVGLHAAVAQLTAHLTR